MPNDFNSVWNEVLLYVPALGAPLAQSITKNCFNRLAERRLWSWRQKTETFTPTTAYVTGTVSITANLQTVVGTGTAWDVTMVGRQIRVRGYLNPIYTIVSVESPTALTIDRPWKGAGGTVTDVGYEIYQVYYTPPADFQEFIAIYDPANNYRLNLNVQQSTLDRYDPQRAQYQMPVAVSQFGYSSNFSGLVGPTLQIVGSGPAPIFTTSYGYSFPQEGTYAITITVGGSVGTAEFTWQFITPGGATSPATVITFDSNPIDLSNGVQVYFPAGTYISGDTFITNCTPGVQTGIPNYELWPHVKVNSFVYPYLYYTKIPELSPDSPQLPPFMRSDVLQAMAMEQACTWPGTDASPNPGYDIRAASYHGQKAETLIYEMEKRDDETSPQDLSFDNFPFAPVPWADGRYAQSHDVPYYGVGYTF